MGREALPEVWDLSGGLPGGPVRVGGLSRLFGKGQEAIPNIQVTIPEFHVGSGNLSGDPDGPPGGLGGSTGSLERLGKPSRRSGTGREALL